MHRRTFTLLSLAALALPTGPAWADAGLDALIASPARSLKNRARDKNRHPAALLAFCGLRPTDTLIELEPGSGYWTEILAPYLKAHGKYIAAIPATALKARAYFTSNFIDKPARYGSITLTGLDDGKPLTPPGMVDRVLSFRNLHDWMAAGTTKENLDVIHAALKPGATFGIEDHRGNPALPQDPHAKSGYVRQDYAINLIEATGFKLTATSELGANPRDTKNYPAGVWTLPPVLALGTTDREKYLAIGESDRFTLKFKKA